MGPYVVMIGKMLRGDVLKFWVIMSTFLCYFATGKVNNNLRLQKMFYGVRPTRLQFPVLAFFFFFVIFQTLVKLAFFDQNLKILDENF